MIVPTSEAYSDDSDDEIEEIDIYRRKYQLLLERCEVLQQDNERIVNRIQQVKKLLRKSRRERKFLMDRLDRYGDNWRNAPLPVELDEPIDPPMPSISHERTVTISKPSKHFEMFKTIERPADCEVSCNSYLECKKYYVIKHLSPIVLGLWENHEGWEGEEGSENVHDESLQAIEENIASTSTSEKAASRKPPPATTPTQSSKRKSTKTPVDPNAPKRPANPFFQFCQEQRSIVLEQVINSGQREPSKQELTKRLATKWNSLTTDDKKIYYDMYEKSKERYTVDMHLYSLNKGKNP